MLVKSISKDRKHFWGTGVMTHTCNSNVPKSEAGELCLGLQNETVSKTKQILINYVCGCMCVCMCTRIHVYPHMCVHAVASAYCQVSPSVVPILLFWGQDLSPNREPLI